MPRIRVVARWLFGLAFIGIGVMHFTHPAPFVSIMPDWLPGHLDLVYVSGGFEILGGLGLLLPMTRRAAAWGLVALLFAVFPANVNMAVNEIYLEGMPRAPWLLWARLPFQFVFMAGVMWTGRIGWWADAEEAGA